MITKSYANLKKGDEFQAYIGLRFKRVRVESKPVLEGSKISFIAQPCLSNKGKERIRLRFDAAAIVEVFDDRRAAA